MNFKKTAAIIAAIAVAATATVSTVYAAGNKNAASAKTSATAPQYNGKTPKYIFMFIGDGMSYPQIQATADYYSALNDTNNNDILDNTKVLNFMNFPVAGSATTYDSTSFCPDSASTATSLSTGHKTYSGTINMDETFTTKYETISEKLKEQYGYKVGIVTTVNLNHATPAAYYAHQASRKNYYEIGLEMVESNFDYFAGGALLKPTGADGDKKDIYKVAEDAGSTISDTAALSFAVAEAVEFYNEHPDETLILVTGDHETGGLMQEQTMIHILQILKIRRYPTLSLTAIMLQSTRKTELHLKEY